MARNQELKASRDKQIVAMYDRLSNVKNGTINVFTHDYILDEVSRSFYLSPSMIMKIIKASVA